MLKFGRGHIFFRFQWACFAVIFFLFIYSTDLEINLTVFLGFLRDQKQKKTLLFYFIIAFGPPGELIDKTAFKWRKPNGDQRQMAMMSSSVENFTFFWSLLFFGLLSSFVKCREILISMARLFIPIKSMHFVSVAIVQCK